MGVEEERGWNGGKSLFIMIAPSEEEEGGTGGGGLRRDREGVCWTHFQKQKAIFSSPTFLLPHASSLVHLRKPPSKDLRGKKKRKRKPDISDFFFSGEI